MGGIVVKRSIVNPAAALAGLAAGCLVAVTVAVAPASAATRPAVTVLVTHNSAIRMPHQLNPGFIHFHVVGAPGHNVQFAHPRRGASAARLKADADALNSAGDPSRLERDFRIQGGANTGADLWVRLEAGKYFALDTSAPSPVRIRTLIVSGPRIDDVNPAHSTVAAVHEMSWAANPRSIPHSGVLRFENQSSDTHFLVLVRIRDSATFAQVERALRQHGQGLGGLLGRHELDTGAISPRSVLSVSYSLPRGRYAMMCFWPGEGGVPHAFLGLVREITLD